MTNTLHIFEMGPRDGLQNEKVLIPTEEKITLINLLSKSGLKKIESASFVSPKWVPQMADGAEVLAGITRQSDVIYSALTPNMKGYERARQAKADEVAIFGSASEGFSKANINCTIEESLERFKPLVEAAKADGIPVRGYVSCVIACPYDGEIAPAQVAKVSRSLLDMGCYEISLGDTIGVGTPETTTHMLEAVLQEVPATHLAGHFHDTNNMALANIETALSFGLRVFDAAVGGLGGCPYAPGAKGNVNTLEVVDLAARLGFETGIDRAQLETAQHFILELKKAFQ
ncbi:hydroxymethylglutaryl-CoA lyase [Flexibacterium corallicola]|uniref:hydroxymethylglutaryl-CoA lyase n=1 Tax=Flexibacterium corallicola TaxID=3037259 RepID=UPI00286F5D5C|nr:hydroxymethylglutaryl-CoA lyase [Pseudovibrio sp. M1P-2-3]